MSQSRLYELADFETLMEPQAISTVSTLYNGSSGTVAGIDTAGYDGVTLIINTGTFTGAATVDVQFFTSPTADSTYGTAITSASVTAIDSAADDTQYKAYYKCLKGDEYLYVRTVFRQTALAGVAPMSIIAALDRGQKKPDLARSSLQFCIDGSV
jgi:hypothetical protein